MCTPVGFLKKTNHYDNFNCYCLGIAKPVVSTSENLAEPDYDVIKMATILNNNENLLFIIIVLILGQFLNKRYQNVVCKFLKKYMTEPDDDAIKMATILNLNKTYTLPYNSINTGSFLKNETPTCSE